MCITSPSSSFYLLLPPSSSVFLLLPPSSSYRADLHFEQGGGGHAVVAEYKLRGEANGAWEPIPVYTDASPSGSGTRLLVRDEPQRQEDSIASVSNVNML